MCGIFGVITNQNLSIGKIALEGIKRLEYRGYDSCGIVTQFNSKLHIKKDAGKIDEIHKKIKFLFSPLQRHPLQKRAFLIESSVLSQ